MAKHSQYSHCHSVSIVRAAAAPKQILENGRPKLCYSVMLMMMMIIRIFWIWMMMMNCDNFYSFNDLNNNKQFSIIKIECKMNKWWKFRQQQQLNKVKWKSCLPTFNTFFSLIISKNVFVSPPNSLACFVCLIYQAKFVGEVWWWWWLLVMTTRPEPFSRIP